MSRIELLQRENKILKDVARLIRIKHKYKMELIQYKKLNKSGFENAIDKACIDVKINRVRDMIARRLELYYDNAKAQEIFMEVI